MELFPPESSEMDLRSVFSWTQETSTSSSFSPLAARPCWRALRQPRSSHPGRSLVIHKPQPWRSWGDKAPASWSPSRVWRQTSCAHGSERGLAPPAGRQRRAGSPALTDPRGLTQNQLCCEHSDWKPKLKWSQKSPWPCSTHGQGTID